MKDFRGGFLTGLGAGLLVLAFSREACAYIDPASGSFILQILIAGIVGAAFALKMFWRSVKSFFVRLFTGKRAETGQTPPDPEDPSKPQSTDAQDDPE